MAIVVISPEAFWQLPGPFVYILKNAGHEVRYPSQKTFTRGNDPDELTLQELAGATAVIAGGERLHAEVLRQLPDLRVIARCGVGYDRVDVPAASDLGKVVTITPFSNHEAVAEHAFALILGLTKYVALNDRRVRAGGWSTTLTKPIRGQTLGLIEKEKGVSQEKGVRSLSFAVLCGTVRRCPEPAASALRMKCSTS